MDFLPRTLLRGVLRLGSGEFVARLASITTVILLGHRYGVVILGVYALARIIHESGVTCEFWSER